MKPTLPGYQIGNLIGEGVCGRVWAAEDPVGNAVAVRTLSALSVNLDLVREVGRRLHGVNIEGHGPIPIWLQALDLKPAMEVSPLLADAVGEELVPRNLQALLADYLATSKSESVVKCLAKALAALHRHQVVHGNLKPGNVFVSEEGRILVGDYGLGWMPGIDVMGFSDALLYMSPEQLLDPGGLHSEAGYRWDVFAFGVLAYRLLEGKFPRCHESFEDVAPAAGVLHKEGIEVDFAGVATQLQKDEMRPWEGKHDEALKGIIERCLSIEPNERFRDMVELCEVWERETLAARHAAEMKVVASKLRTGRRWKRGLGWGLAASLFLGAAAGVGWMTREKLLADQVERALIEKQSAEKMEELAIVQREEAIGVKASLEGKLDEALADVEQLGASQQMLFEWALIEGSDEVPVLIGREGRLELLDRQYQKLIRAKSASGEEWTKQWQAEQALVALCRNKPDEARALVDGDLSRLGGLGLTRLLLKESGVGKVPREDLALARTLIKKTSGRQEPWLQSALDLVEVRNLERADQSDRALRLLAENGEKVAELPSLLPGTISLWRTRLQREAADVAEGAGREALAQELRVEIVKDLRNELGADGLSEQVREHLTKQFVIVAEGLAEQQFSLGEVPEAMALSEEALTLIPESAEPRVRMALAVHEAVIAGCLRGKGQKEEAMSRLKQGLALLDKSFDDASDERWRKYRLGVLKWQLAGVLGQSEEDAQGLEEGQEALAIIRELQEEDGLQPSAIQLHRVAGYLSGDLAQSYLSAGQKDVSDELLDEAIESWKFLSKANPEEPEYVAGLAWCEKLKGE